MRRPNNEYRVGTCEDYEHNGNNDFNTKFLHIYDALLDFSYQSITENGKYFNKFDSNGKNLCYISEPEFERKLNEFISLPTDGYKILVGFTGMGKTTLLKNYFGITGRRPFFDKEGRLIAYKSFHSERINSENVKRGIGKIDEIIAGYVSSIIEYLVPNIDYEKLNWEEFAEYIKENKNEVLNRSAKIPGYVYDVNKELKKMCEEDPFEYYSCLLKFVMKENNIERDLVLIFDNIESVNLKFHIPILEKIFSFNTCLSYNKNRKYSVKAIISMRGYTFRYNLFRQGEAYRIANEDVIVKNSIPDLIKLIEKRISVIEKNPAIMEKIKIKSKDSWDEAKKELLQRVRVLDVYYKNLLTGLTHNNISRTAKLLFKITTNERWLKIRNEDEQISKGSFIAKADNYIWSNKEAIMKALVYGEGDVYIDYEDNILPNILHFHAEKRQNCELLGLYLLTYFQKTNTSLDQRTILYGNTKIKGKDALEKIIEALCREDDKKFKKSLQYMIDYLYCQGLLLHSIYEPEVLRDNCENYERVYDETYGLYISSRARTILSMLERSSIIMEFYRDDIDTDLENNDRVSTSLGQAEKFIYLIKYMDKMLEIESKYIEEVIKKGQIEAYRFCFGNSFLVSRLIKGILVSFKKYYGKKEQDYYSVYDVLERLMRNCFETEKRIYNEICFEESIKNFWNEIKTERMKI